MSQFGTNYTKLDKLFGFSSSLKSKPSAHHQDIAAAAALSKEAQALRRVPEVGSFYHHYHPFPGVVGYIRYDIRCYRL